MSRSSKQSNAFSKMPFSSRKVTLADREFENTMERGKFDALSGRVGFLRMFESGGMSIDELPQEPIEKTVKRVGRGQE